MVRCGNELVPLTELHRMKLEPRCEAGLIDGFKADVARLDQKAVIIATIRESKKASTLNQNDALGRTADILSLLRGSITDHFPSDKTLHTEFGIGLKIRRDSVPSLKAASAKFLEGAQRHADKARAAGILPEDIEELASTSSAAAGADVAQEASRASSRETTAERNLIHRRVEVAITKIRAVAKIAFRNEPEIRDAFERAIPATRASLRSKKKKSSEGAADVPE
ncbi:MAG TPA: hypothetical protein DFS52_28085 [Myxococcales bacterium]|nr:hypothetical protein [Myxococcales bacterium]